MNNEIILSAGIDIGTTTTHLIISEIEICVTEGFGVVPGAQIVSKKIIYQSPVYFTPLTKEGLIDKDEVAKIIDNEYKSFGIDKSELKSGAVIITGESSRKDNAQEALHKISDYAGNFVVAQAGSELESFLAGKGAGADIVSEDTLKTVANVDIGGGTTNISLFENGDCVDTCCLNIGGRLLKSSNGKVIYKSPITDKLCKNNNIIIGSTDDKAAIKKLCSVMAKIIIDAVYKNDNKDLSVCTDDHLLTGDTKPEIICFSGGVAQCMNGNYDDFEFGDIGVILSREIVNIVKKQNLTVFESKNKNPIRATVIGAGNFSMEISGSTICFDGISFPIKNLPCYTSFGDIKDKPCAISIEGEVSPSFEYVMALAEKIKHSTKELVKNKIPIVVITKYDFSKALGQCLKGILPSDYPIICADGIFAKKGDYIDIGSPVANGTAVPVVVKTLVFGGEK